MSEIQSGYAILSQLQGASYEKDASSVTDKIVDFWQKFNQDMKTYVEAMSDDTTETVEIQGHIVRKDSAAATYLADKWNSDTLSVIDRLLAIKKNDLDLSNKLFSLFGG
ncbi:MAG: hypothetical protein MUC35_05960 [Candidatus Margulisbacteria bacterium]|jgi:hypothetical protein|nr:hypothetical protein [Candidatus Margulisiibacteriota bacterium]